MSETVDHPGHYNLHPAGIECIAVAEEFGFNLGNVFKYVWRAGLKPGVSDIEDLQKAAWYLNREIERRKKRAAPAEPKAAFVEDATRIEPGVKQGMARGELLESVTIPFGNNIRVKSDNNSPLFAAPGLIALRNDNQIYYGIIERIDGIYFRVADRNYTEFHLSCAYTFGSVGDVVPAGSEVIQIGFDSVSTQ